MLRKKLLLSLLTLFLFTGAALAQNGTSDQASAAHEECQQEYREALAEAEEEDDPEEAREERAEAEEEYQECLAEAREEREEDEDDEREDDEEERFPVPASYEGKHVSFDVTAYGIANYTVGDHAIFDSVEGSEEAQFEYLEKEGAKLELEGEHAEVKIIDNPRGVFRFEAEDDGRVHVVFADGIDVRPAQRDGDDRFDRSGHGRFHYVLTGPDNMTAHLFAEEGAHYENGTLTASEEIRLVVVNAPGLRDRSDASHQGVRDGRIAAEVDVPRRGQAIDAEYGDVNVTVERTSTGLIAHVDREDPEGRTILFNLDEAALGDLGALQVLFDGEPIGLADDAEDVLDTSDGVAEYLILVGGNGAEVLVQVPHFSPHTIELVGESSAAFVPAPSAGLLGASILGLAAVAHTVRRS